MIGWFKKKRKEESAMTEDEKQEAKAKEDIAEKGADSQTEKDRIDESVGEQEHLDGNEDSQSAKDRVDESEGAQRADEAREEEKKEDVPKWAEKMLSSLDRIVSYVEEQAKSKAPANAADAAAAEKLDAAFGAGEGVFQGEESHEGKKMTKAEIADLVHKIMR